MSFPMMNRKMINGESKTIEMTTNRMKWLMVFAAGLLLLASGACSKHSAGPEVIVEIPQGFNGDFLLEMGVKDAPPLLKQGEAYRITVPKGGKLLTSTLVANPRMMFQNSSEGGVWGYTHSVFSTGDGIPIGGKIEFFVGTKKDYEAEEKKKNHSDGFTHLRNWRARA